MVEVRSLDHDVGRGADEPRHNRFEKLFRRENVLICILAIAFVMLSLSHASFLTKGNLFATGNGMAGIMIVTIGMTIALISGGFDLSVGAVIAITSVVLMTLVQQLPPSVAVASALILGTIIGTINGVLISVININPLIATLGTAGMARGIAEVMSNGTIVSPAQELPDWLVYIGNGSLFGFPVLVLWALALVVFFDLALRNTSFFRKVYFIGGSEKAAHFAGINVTRVKILVYTLSGSLAGLAGVLLASRFGAGTATFGFGYELQAISAAVIGGVALTGGVGTVAGAFLAVLLLALVQDAIILFHVSVFWQNFIYGAILVIAVAITQIGGARTKGA